MRIDSTHAGRRRSLLSEDHRTAYVVTSRLNNAESCSTAGAAASLSWTYARCWSGLDNTRCASNHFDSGWSGRSASLVRPTCSCRALGELAEQRTARTAFT